MRYIVVTGARVVQKMLPKSCEAVAAVHKGQQCAKPNCWGWARVHVTVACALTVEAFDSSGGQIDIIHLDRVVQSE